MKPICQPSVQSGFLFSFQLEAKMLTEAPHKKGCFFVHQKFMHAPETAKTLVFILLTFYISFDVPCLNEWEVKFSGSILFYKLRLFQLLNFVYLNCVLTFQAIAFLYWPVMMQYFHIFHLIDGRKPYSEIYVSCWWLEAAISWHAYAMITICCSGLQWVQIFPK